MCPAPADWNVGGTPLPAAIGSAPADWNVGGTPLPAAIGPSPADWKVGGTPRSRLHGGYMRRPKSVERANQQAFSS